MVLDAGRIVSPLHQRLSLHLNHCFQVEFDTPSALLREKDSKFRAMVEGSEDSATLHSIAEGKL